MVGTNDLITCASVIYLSAFVVFKGDNHSGDCNILLKYGILFVQYYQTIIPAASLLFPAFL